MPIFTHIEIKEGLFSFEEAHSLGYALVQQTGKTTRFVATFEVIFGADGVKKTASTIEGPLWYIRLAIQVTKTSQQVNIANLSMLAANVEIGAASATYDFSHQVPANVAALLPKPGQFNLENSEKVFASISASIDALAESAETPPVAHVLTAASSSMSHDAEKQRTLSVWSALNSMAWGATGLALRDAKKIADKQKLDPDIVAETYRQIGGATSEHLCPGISAENDAEKWINRIKQGAI